jgi:predicted glycoside hydrolase/deacetylase ChbG (UPF0249 family)
MRYWLLILLFLTAPGLAETVAERLGLPADAKLLIIHADDIGMSHSVNLASFNAFEAGIVNSGSMMVPCAWFDEAAFTFKADPTLDLGLHLTLTSEWAHYKWSSLSGAGPRFSLHNPQGYQYPDVPFVVQNASTADVKAEIEAQVEAAYAHGIRPTHLDSHMGTLFASPEFFNAYVETGRKHRLPLLIPREALLAQSPELAQSLQPDEMLVDRIFMADPSIALDQFDEYYTDVIENLEPGVTEIIIHLGFDDIELQAITVDHPDYGAAWRQTDWNFFTRPQTKALLDANNVHLVTWRALGKILYKDE